MPIITTSKRKAKRATRKPYIIILIIIVAVCAFCVINNGRKPETAMPQEKQIETPENIPATSEAQNAENEEDPKIDDSILVTDTAISSNSVIDSAMEDIAKREREPVNRKFVKPIEGFNGGPAEQLICMMMSANDKYGMPPLPMSSESVALKDFMNAITNDIIVYETDSEEVVAFKEKVAEVKNRLAEIVEQGGSITNALKEYENWINENAAIRREVRREYNRLKEEASLEEADAYLAEANKELEAEGIATVNLGKERKRNRAKRDAREAEALKILQEQAK